MDFITVFALGAIVGSFLNVCIYRIPREMSLVSPSSRCSFCAEPISWYDNIPFFSFVWLRGKCRFCQSFFSFRYPFIELLTGILFLLCYYQFVASDPSYPQTWNNADALAYLSNHLYVLVPFFLGCLFLSALVVAAFIDFDFQIIPDSISLGGLALSLLVSFLYPKWHLPFDSILDSFVLDQNIFLMKWRNYLEHWMHSELGGWTIHCKAFLSSLLGAFVGASTIWIVGIIGKIIFRKDAMGLGDVKFNAMIGAFLGWRIAFITLLLGAVFGSISGIIILIKTKQSRMPFGPYLSLSACLLFLFRAPFFRLTEWWKNWVHHFLMA